MKKLCFVAKKLEKFDASRNLGVFSLSKFSVNLNLGKIYEFRRKRPKPPALSNLLHYLSVRPSRGFLLLSHGFIFFGPPLWTT